MSKAPQSRLITEAEAGLKEIFPIVGSKQELRLLGVSAQGGGDADDRGKIKEVKLRNGTFGSNLVADLELVDKQTGRSIDRQKVNVGTIPTETPHGTYVVGGTEYQASNQHRLKHGVFTRRKSNGTFESYINPKDGHAAKVILDPETRKFTVLANNRSFRLYDLLRDAGVDDSAIKEAWGDELYDANRSSRSSEGRAARGFLRDVVNKTAPDDDQEMAKMLKDEMGNTSQLDGSVNRVTLGKAHESLSPDFFMDTSKRLLAVQRGQAPQDFRDEVFFQSYRDGADFLKERLTKKAPSLQRRAKRGIDRAESVTKALYPQLIRDTIEQTFTTTELVNATETTNPLDIVSSGGVITMKGTGGVRSNDAITLEARDVQPSSMGFIDPVKTPAGSAGVNTHLAVGSRIENGNIVTRMYDLRQGKFRDVSNSEIAGKVVAFPGEFDFSGVGRPAPKKGKVRATQDDRVLSVAGQEVDFIVPDAREMFSEVTNMIPFLEANSGPRAQFGANQMTQAVPLKFREARMVQTVAPGGGTFDRLVGEKFLAKAPFAGEVVEVTPDYITIKGKGAKKRVSIYNNYPLSRESFLHDEPKVKVGDKVSDGQILVESNFTKGGDIALGQNMVFALAPYRGYTYEDGVVVSETGARKLTSEHLRSERGTIVDGGNLNKNQFKAVSGGLYLDPRQDSQIGSDGLIKPGSIVKPGDVLATVVSQREPNTADRIAGVVGIRPSLLKADPVVWNHDVAGVVTDARRVGKNIQVYVKTEEPAKVGDKISAADGGKGVITKIIPDADAPRRKSDGKIIDIIMDPHGVPSRMNIGQIYELAAGKISEKTEKPYLVENFSGEDLREKLSKDLAEAGLKDKETIFDPVTGQDIPDVNVGRKHIFKLKHQVDKKIGVRGVQEGYDSDEQPADGKKMDRLTTYALLAHGADEILRETAVVKSTKQHGRLGGDDYWEMIRRGERNPYPMTPTFAFKKFEGMLNGLGVKMDRQGSNFVLNPLTDKEILEMSNGEIIRPDTLIGKNLKEIDGGLFDPVITGGLGGSRSNWSHIALPEAVPNPVFEKPIASLLGVPVKQVADIVAGKKTLDGQTGVGAIAKKLESLDIDREIKDEMGRAASATSLTQQNKINDRVSYLKGLKKSGLRPEDAYLLKNVPVLPPNMRPIIELDGGSRAQADVNELYRRLLVLTKNGYNDAQTAESKDNVRSDIYGAVKNIMGIGSDPLIREKGLLAEIAGDRPKKGFYQAKVVYGPQDASSRMVITNDPTLGVDEVGLPVDAAIKMYEPFVNRRLRASGISAQQAFSEVEQQTPLALKHLEAELKERPVLINRAPSWHRFNITAMKPKLHMGKDLKVPNLPVNSLYGGDFDGDTMMVHLPLSTAAVREANQIMPSKFLFKPGTRLAKGDDPGKLLLKPEASALIGLNYLTRLGKKTQKTYGSEDEALRAESIEKLRADDQIVVGGKPTTIGRIKIGKVLHPNVPFPGVFDKNTIDKYLKDVADKAPEDYARVVNSLNQLGDEYSTLAGFSLSLSDIKNMDSAVSSILSEVPPDDIDAIGDVRVSGRVSELIKARTKMEKMVSDPTFLDPAKNEFARMMHVSGKGNAAQIRQVMAAGMLYEDSRGRIVPEAVEDSFAKGLTPGQFFIQQIGGRKGIVDRSELTSRPGEIGKQLLASSADRVISEVDCGTSQSIEVNIETSPNSAYDHVAAETFGSLSKGSVVTPSIVADLLKKGHKVVRVRSPLRCQSKHGLCQKCYGLNERGTFPPIGENVGVQDTQTLVERSANFTLKSFHTSGANESANGSVFDRYRELVQVPKKIPNQATVSRVDGVVEKIQPSGAGGHDVIVSGVRHNIPIDVSVLPTLVPGQRVSAGDLLSSGRLRPQDLLQYKGIDAAQDYMTDELHGLMQGFGINRKTVESVVSGITNLTQIQDPGDSDFSPFDFAQRGLVESFNSSLGDEIPVEQAVGLALRKPAGRYKKGEIVTDNMIFDLKGQGIRRVVVEKKPIMATPVLRPAAHYPLLKQDDWLAKLDFNRLDKTIMEGAARGSVSDIHGFNPISAYAYGAEFGRRPDEKEGRY